MDRWSVSISFIIVRMLNSAGSEADLRGDDLVPKHTKDEEEIRKAQSVAEA